VLVGRTSRVQAGATPSDAIMAFCIDFNWGEGGPNGFARPGLWAEASPEEHVAWYAALGCNVIQTFAVSCNGYAWYRGGPVPPQPGLKRDFLTEMVKLAHARGMKVMGYYCVGANTLWGLTHTNLSYGAPSDPHIPLTREYLDYLCGSIADGLKRTGMDGFMIDWVWNPGDIGAVKMSWLDCEQRMFGELFGVPFPGKDKISKAQELEFRRRAIDRCWERIRDTTRRVKPDAVIWLSCCDVGSPVVTNSKLFKEVDWLMNEATDPKALEQVERMKGPHTRLVQCVVGWGDAHDARRIVLGEAAGRLGIYGFSKPGANSLPLPVEAYRRRPIASFQGNDHNIAVLARYFTGASLEAIDRQALVKRHNIEWNDPGGQIPLGNGEFCFNADGTGLQTFGGSTMAHWAWHSAPLPPGCATSDLPATGTVEKGRIAGPMRQASGRKELDGWMFRNPHPMNLGRLRFLRSSGAVLAPGEIRSTSRHYDLWAGMHLSRFEVDGQPVAVETCVHPTLDLIAVRAESPLLRDGTLVVALDFPYSSANSRSPWAGEWNRPGAHTSQLVAKEGERRAEIHRTADAAHYQVFVGWSDGCSFSRGPEVGPGEHSFRFAGGRAGRIEFVCGFSGQPLSSLPTVSETQQAVVEYWRKFWSTGGAIDLSQSKDPRWKELERRIVLSQYQMAAQSAGSWPPAEDGLMGVDPWSGQFHMEMTWWHLAHYGLWGRWPMAERALGCYRAFLPVARQLAGQFNYRGAKWGKQVGPEGRTAPWEGSFVLHWQQPHPIFFAELEYRLRPTRATLEKWRDIVFATADYMAGFPSADEAGSFHLQPIMPPSEQGVTRDTVFDLAYWRWGLDQAQRWRERLGQAREPRWDQVRLHLAPLPTADGVFVQSVEWTDTYAKRAWEHPDPIGVFGMLPPLEGVDRETAHRTVLKVWQTWDWTKCWGWDFPWMAMAAARVGEPQIAVEALLKDAGTKNRYDERGVNTGGPCPYLPGNGGLLYAVAMMATGWDGAPTRPAPGFPDDATWVVQSEGLSKAP